MLEDPCSYSSTKIAFRLLSVCMLAMSLAACSASNGNKPVIAKGYVAPEPEVASRTKMQATKVASATVKNRIQQIDFGQTGSVAANKRTDNANCRYLKNTAEAEAAIIGSPTLEASSDEEGSGSVSLSMDLLDFNKAKLVRSSADAKCRYHLASKKIDTTLAQARKKRLRRKTMPSSTF